MSWCSKIRSAPNKSRPPRGTDPAQRLARCRPRVESLEDRTVPATVSITTSGLIYQAAAGETNNVTVSLQAGRYTIQDTGAAIAISQPILFLRVNSNTVTVLENFFSTMTLNLSDRADTVTLASLGRPATVNGGNDGDRLNLGTGDLDAVRGAVTFNGEGGLDSAYLMDQAAAAGHSYTLSGTAGAAGRRNANGTTSPFGGLTSPSVETLVLNADPGSNAVTLLSTPSSPWLTANGGAGDDTFTVGNGQLDNNSGGIFQINGQDGHDVVNVMDGSSASNGTYHVAGEGTLTGAARTDNANGGFVLLFGNGEGLVLNAATGSNTITIPGTSAATPVTVNDAGGLNTVNVGTTEFSLANLRGALSVNSGANATGRNALVLNDSAAASGRRYTLAEHTLSRSGAALITFDTLYSLQLTGSAFDDTLNLQNPPVTTGDGRFDDMVLSLGSGLNSVRGPNADTVWSFEDGEDRQVELHGRPSAPQFAARISGVYSVTGGSGRDFFEMDEDGFLPGNLNGGGGVNTLDYLGYDRGNNTGVTVNLSATTSGGTATNVGGLVTNIRTVLGSDFNDTLTGSRAGSILLGFDGNDTLTAGGGNSVLIGGDDRDTLSNSRTAPSYNVLIGDRINFPNVSSAYDEMRVGDAMFDIWQRTTRNNYTSQVERLRDVGVTVDGVAHWLDRFAVIDDGSVDRLIGALPSQAQLDWFFASANDVRVNFHSPEINT